MARTSDLGSYEIEGSQAGSVHPPAEESQPTLALPPGMFGLSANADPEPSGNLAGTSRPLRSVQRSRYSGTIPSLSTMPAAESSQAAPSSRTSNKPQATWKFWETTFANADLMEQWCATIKLVICHWTWKNPTWTPTKNEALLIISIADMVHEQRYPQEPLPGTPLLF